MSADHSVTRMIREINNADASRIQEELVDRYMHRLAALARKKLGAMRTYEDEEDVALSVMKSFLMRAADGQFTQACDRNSLWSLLVAITLKKTASVQRRHLTKKRDVRRNASLEEMLQAGPTDDFLHSTIDEGNDLIRALGDDSLRQVALLRMEGYSNEEIAGRIDRSVKTVERRLQLIRRQLETELTAAADPGEIDD
jgi:DNA-directed RNA polymerase specialized sigma24 family protein